MKEIFAKLSSYNFLNYLLPGAIFVLACRYLNLVDFKNEGILIEFTAYYFAGMTISRVGSILVEPISQYLGIIKHSSYSNYISACEKDGKIEVLLEQNNLYRTIISMFLILLFFLGGKYTFEKLDITSEYVSIILIFNILLLYVLAYRKQTTYIRKRVEKHTKE